MTEDIEKQILKLLKKSSIPGLLKNIVITSWPSLGFEQKKRMLNSLLKEQKKMLSLKKKEQKLIKKYSSVLEKITESGKNKGKESD